MTVPVGDRWSPEKVEAMRQELLSGGLLTEIALREGVTKQRISQLVGKLNRRTAAEAAEIAHRLLQAGMSDEQVAQELGVSVKTAMRYYVRAGYRRSKKPSPLKKWTAQLIIQAAQDWSERHGYTPCAGDWNPAMARAQGHFDRVAYYYESDYPHPNSVYREFDSWSDMISQAGLVPSPRGGAAAGRFSNVKRYDKQSIIQAARKWHELFGEWPRPIEWKPEYWRNRQEPIYLERQRRFSLVKPPTYESARHSYGSFWAMLEAAQQED